jgi:4-amino-4-deoxy-L-arabinose transferase-like glycosyltransferase
MVVAGASSLVKSPLYSVFLVLGYWIYFVGSRKHENVKKLPRRVSFYLAHLLGVLVGVSWFFLVWLTDRERFWSQYIVQETFGKRGGNSSSAIGMGASSGVFFQLFSVSDRNLFVCTGSSRGAFR